MEKLVMGSQQTPDRAGVNKAEHKIMIEILCDRRRIERFAATHDIVIFCTT